MIISTLERRTWQGRLAMTTIYVALFLGAITMVYPFLLMLRLSTADATDQETLSPLPEFWWSKSELARKYLKDQYLTSGELLAFSYGADDWTDLVTKTDLYEAHFAPLEKVPTAQLRRRAEDFLAYRAAADPRFVYVQFGYVPGRTRGDMELQTFLAQRSGRPAEEFRFREPPRPDFKRRDWVPAFDGEWYEWQDWVAQLRPEERYVYSTNFPWQNFLRNRYEGDLTRLNAAHGTAYRSFADGPVFATAAPPAGTALRADWDAFVIGALPLYWQRLTPAAVERLTPEWQRFLTEKKGIATAEEWAKRTGRDPVDPATMVLPREMPPSDVAGRWWSQFVAEQAGADDRELVSSEEAFQEMLRKKYGSLGDLNAAWGTDFAQWQTIRLPAAELDFVTLTQHRAGIALEKTIGNYRTVLRMLVGSGGGPFLNTLIIILLSVATSLTVNPLAAYALSRFRLRRTQKALIFILATMALPSEVALVPGFLLVRDLHLTDNFLALVLPSAANAFSIFLLKGFFDSLPQELYEAATIDGAGEIRMFVQITLPLAMPIIAVTLLGTITHAYNLFMPAVMYLGDTSMWPIASKIYEINQTSPIGVGMAALVVASIFPLLVFVFCQRIIMRGIILPSMK